MNLQEINMELTNEELSLISDLAFAASLDCDSACADQNDNYTAHSILQCHAEIFLEISKKTSQELEKRKTNDD